MRQGYGQLISSTGREVGYIHQCPVEGRQELLTWNLPQKDTQLVGTSPTHSTWAEKARISPQLIGEGGGKHEPKTTKTYEGPDQEESWKS